MLTLPDQPPTALMEVVVRYARRFDLCIALREAERALEVLLAWLVRRRCDPAKDEYRRAADHERRNGERHPESLHHRSGYRHKGDAGSSGNSLRSPTRVASVSAGHIV